MDKEDLYSHPGWDACTFDGAREQVLRLGLETTFLEKLRWLEEAEILTLRLRENQSPNLQPDDDGSPFSGPKGG
jgi:hypothetical protein